MSDDELVTLEFDAEILLPRGAVKEHGPAQAVQNAIGGTGAKVIDAEAMVPVDEDEQQ